MLPNNLFVSSEDYRHYTSSELGIVGAEYARLGQAHLPLLSTFILSSSFFQYFYSEKTVGFIHDTLKKGDGKQLKTFIKQIDPSKEFLKKMEQCIDSSDSNRLVTITLSPHWTDSTAPFLTIPPSTSNITQALVDLLLKYTQEVIDKHLLNKSKVLENFFPAFFFQFQRKCETSGLIWTIDPLHQEKKHLIVKAWWGRPEAIQKFPQDADTIVMNKFTYEVQQEDHQTQKKEVESNSEGIFQVQVPISRQDKKKLTEKEMIELAMIAKKVHQHLFFPQRITWVKRHKNFYIVRSEDIIDIPQLSKQIVQSEPLKPLLSGVSMGHGSTHAPVQILSTSNDLRTVQKTEILVCKKIPKEISSQHCSGVICENPLEPRMFEHWTIPIVANCKGVMKKLKHGEKVFIDSRDGIVYC